MGFPVVVERRFRLPLEEMSSWTRTAGVVPGRMVFSLVQRNTARGEIAGFLAEDPAAITGYLRQGEGLKREAEKGARRFRKSRNKSIFKSDT
jgi:hypothetical protein